MEFNEVIEKRRTTRQFTSESIEKEQIVRIIEAGLKAPTFDHTRKWNFVVITNEQKKMAAIAPIEPLPCAIKEPKNPLQEMIKIAFPKQHSMFAEAPCLILPLYKRDPRIVNEKGPRTLMDCAEMWCVIENIFLATTNEGLSTAMRIPTEGQPEEILRIVGCPQDYILPCIIGIGHPSPNAEYPQQVYPKLEDCIHWERW